MPDQCTCIAGWIGNDCQQGNFKICKSLKIKYRRSIEVTSTDDEFVSICLTMSWWFPHEIEQWDEA